MPQKKRKIVASQMQAPPHIVTKARERRVSKYADVLESLKNCKVGEWVLAENVDDLLKFRQAIHQSAKRRGTRVNVVNDPEKPGVVWVLNVGPKSVPPSLAAGLEGASPTVSALPQVA